jgi:hypothetical protein
MAMTRKQAGNKLMRQIDYGMANSSRATSGIGAMMGFMGLPFLSRGDDVGKGSSGSWMTVDPRNQSMYAPGSGGGGGGGGNPPQIEDPPLPPYDPNDPNGDGSGKFSWQFPQYSQTWAFTPPAPTPYPYPQPFDPKKYGDPFAKDKKK